VSSLDDSPPNTKTLLLSTAQPKFCRADHVDVDATAVHVTPESMEEYTSFNHDDPSYPPMMYRVASSTTEANPARPLGSVLIAVQDLPKSS
jgi:hypothetical protein